MPHKPILEEHSIYGREAHATATLSRMLTSEDIATVRKNHNTHSDRSSTDTQGGVCHLQKIPCAPA